MINRVLANKARINNHIKRFSKFGRTKDNAITRLALSKDDQKARDYFYEYCEKIGLTVKVDDLGNIYGTLEGKMERPPIVIGSHIDTVENGGKFDGVLGVIAGLEVIETFIENNITPHIPITIVNFTNEEGVRFEPAMMSSGVLAGKFSKDKIMKVVDRNGITFEEALKEIQYDGSPENRLDDATAFLELHIEQGPILDREDIAIGIVDSVIGMTCYDIEIIGESNHAGTTPMTMRQDALFLANDIIAELRMRLKKLDKRLVYTIGRLDVHPNLHTVIPGKVSFTLEVRHKDSEIINQAESVIEDSINSFIPNSCIIRFKKSWTRDTILLEENIRTYIEQAALDLEYSYTNIDSGAGHDAQFIAEIVPTGMIFVPSIAGKSHCKEEYTSLENCYKGINVLLKTILKILKNH